MPNYTDAFPSKFLKAADLKGQQVVVTIESVKFEPVGREKEIKAVIYFVGKQKGFIVNKVNGKKVAEIANSPLTEDWSGVPIALYPTECEFSGETVDCIRVKAVTRPSQPARPPIAPVLPVIQRRAVNAPVSDSGPLTEDEIPF